MKKILLGSLATILCLNLSAQHTLKIKVGSTPKSESNPNQKVKVKNPSPMQLLGNITCGTSYVAGTTMDLNFNLLLSNSDLEYGDSLSLTFPAGITPISSPTDPIGPDDGSTASDGPEILNGVSGQSISWGNNDNNYGGIVPGVNYPFVVKVTVAPGTSGLKTVSFFVSGDGFGGNGADLSGNISLFDTPPPFTGCSPTNIYGTSSWQEASAIGTIYSGYICSGHDSLLTRSGWQFYDGDGYFINLIAGGQYRIKLDSCVAPIAISVSDSNGILGAIIPGAYTSAACPNQLVFTAPYTGKYYINASLNGLCGNSGATAIASASVKLLNNALCPNAASFPINDTICGAIEMTLDSVYSGNTGIASSTDPRDASATAAGFACSTPNNTLWYKYTALAKDTFYLTTNSPATGGLDAWVGVFTATSCTSVFTSGNCLGGAAPGFSYIDTLAFTAGTTYYFMVDGFSGATGTFDIQLTRKNAGSVFSGCIPTSTYTTSSWEEPSSIGTTYNGYVCNQHDSIQTRNGWQFYDGDGYFVYLVAGGQYRIALDSCTAPIALTVSDSNGVAGNIIPNAFIDAACPNQLTLTAPYTGKYYITTNLNGICGNMGATPIASGSVVLLNSVTCPTLPTPPANDSICGAIAMTLGTTYSGNTTYANATDPRDADATAAGFACSTPNNTLWYSYTATATDTFYITTNSPSVGGLDTWVGVFEGGNCTAAFSSGVCMFGAAPGTYYIDTVYFTAGSTYYIMVDGFGGAVGFFDIQLTQQNGSGTNFTGCLPTNVYGASSWMEPSNAAAVYSGYVCNGHDTIQTRAGWQFYDGDGYFVYLVSGGQYQIALDSCSAAIAITVSDSGAAAGNIIPGAFVNAACPNQLTFTAPYTGKYYINTSLNGICGNTGATAIASGSVVLLNSVTCPTLPTPPANDSICGAIAMTLGTTYSGNTTYANATDPRDADATAAGFGCSTPNNTLWYSYTATVTDTFFITTNSPAVNGLDSWVGVFEGGNCTAAFTNGACMFGAAPGTYYIDTVYFTAGSTYYIMVDGFSGAVGLFDIQLTQQTGGGSNFTGCLPTNVYPASSWMEPSAAAAIYSGYVCNGHDTIQTRAGWQFYDGDGYYVYLVAGGQYKIALDSCSAPIAITVSDSGATSGNIIPGTFVNAACPNQLTFTAPYTGKYYINTSLYGICGNTGTTAIASGSVVLLNSVTCPSGNAFPANDTICGAIPMNLGTTYNGNTMYANATDPRDADVTAAGFGCSIPNNTLWYSYTATVSDTFFITTNSPASNGLDTWVGIFEGTGCNAPFISGDCLFGAAPGSSYVDTVYFTAGSTYYIMVDGYSGAVGTFSIELTQNNNTIIYPYNDTICGAINMTLGTTYADDNSTANSSDPNDNNVVAAGYNCDAPSNTLWYTYTPSVSDTFYLTSTSPAVIGLNLAIGFFEASNCNGTISNGTCSLASLPGGTHVDTLLLTAGTTYYFMMDGFGNSQGLFTVSLTKANHGVGVKELTASSLFAIYPNPSDGMINLTVYNKMSSIEIYNALGAKVFEQNQLSQGTHTFNLSNLAKGIYSVKATNGKTMEIKTISIQH